MIRFATPEDVPTIARLIRGLAEYEKHAHLVTLDEARLHDHIFGKRPYVEVLLVEEEGKVVGFALFFHSYSTFAGKPGLYLEDLFVEPEHRGKGHGKALFVELAKLAVERNCRRIEWSVLNWNEPAIQFYKSLGAKPMDDWTVYRYTVTGEAMAQLAGVG
jgi:GNAT superfamily N-acetyltransferase